MKSNLTEGDYQICELLRGLWMTMERMGQMYEAPQAIKERMEA